MLQRRTSHKQPVVLGAVGVRGGELAFHTREHCASPGRTMRRVFPAHAAPSDQSKYMQPVMTHAEGSAECRVPQKRAKEIKRWRKGEECETPTAAFQPLLAEPPVTASFFFCENSSVPQSPGLPNACGA
ncbi:hypothetical protein MHYP_G00327860 [Metynnis hypsauchen]